MGPGRRWTKPTRPATRRSAAMCRSGRGDRSRTPAARAKTPPALGGSSARGGHRLMCDFQADVPGFFQLSGFPPTINFRGYEAPARSLCEGCTQHDAHSADLVVSPDLTKWRRRLAIGQRRRCGFGLVWSWSMCTAPPAACMEADAPGAHPTIRSRRGRRRGRPAPATGPNGEPRTCGHRIPSRRRSWWGQLQRTGSAPNSPSRTESLKTHRTTPTCAKASSVVVRAIKQAWRP